MYLTNRLGEGRGARKVSKSSRATDWTERHWREDGGREGGKEREGGVGWRGREKCAADTGGVSSRPTCHEYDPRDPRVLSLSAGSVAASPTGMLPVPVRLELEPAAGVAGGGRGR